MRHTFFAQQLALSFEMELHGAHKGVFQVHTYTTVEPLTWRVP